MWGWFLVFHILLQLLEYLNFFLVAFSVSLNIAIDTFFDIHIISDEVTH